MVLVGSVYLQDFLPYILKVPHVITISFVLTLVVGFIPCVGRFLDLSRIVCFLPYFLLGHKIANDESFLKAKRLFLTNFNNRRGYLLALVTIFAFWMCFIYFNPGLTYATVFTYGYSSIMGCLLRIALEITILLTGYLIICIFPNNELWFTKYGSRTLNVYLLHGMIVLPFAYMVFKPFAVAEWYMRILMILLPAVLCMFLFSRSVDRVMKRLLSVFK